ETFRFSVPFRDEEGTRVLCSFLGSLAARSDVLARKGTYKDLIKSSLAECLKSGEDGVSERRGVLGSHLSTLLFMRVEKRYVEDSDNPSLINFELVFVWEAERVHQWEARKADISWLEDADSQPIEQYFS
ncbi:MAG: hypothetical protein JWL85_393, partial [Candidatus Saccharibacteria bacterium]|nr:hypothetical protein [Candidatus Saccharibacteria bacterium]